MKVHCPRCQSDNPSDSQFCSDCGTRLNADTEVFDSRTVTLSESPEELSTGAILKEKYRILGKVGSALFVERIGKGELLLLR
jgi:hypothetical protein